MKLIRIGEKLIDFQKINSMIDKILELREKGMSQQEVAKCLNIDRTFISRLESIGEIRKGGKISVIGFPIGNKQELKTMLEKEKIEYYLIMTDIERRAFVSNKSGQQLLNQTMDIITKVRSFDTIIILGSNYRINLCNALLDKEVIGVEIGTTPISEDVFINIDELQKLIKRVKGV